jgi:hypothetical protein
MIGVDERGAVGGMITRQNYLNNKKEKKTGSPRRPIIRFTQQRKQANVFPPP